MKNLELNRTAIIYTSLALLAFAANSVLCRLALVEGEADPVSFTALRLIAGALFLAVLVRPKITVSLSDKRFVTNVIASFCLFFYAVFFSFAYDGVDTATGALVLFGMVQLTLLLISIIKGIKPNVGESLGMALACFGLCWLLLPAAGRPSIEGLVLMAFSGVAWAIYTFVGRGLEKPIELTAVNFIFTLPMTFALLLIFHQSLDISTKGIALAVASGALTSGLGYVLWYLALKYLSILQSAVCQLFVPVLAMFGGLIFVFESPGSQLIFSGLFILGGIFITSLAKRPQKKIISE